MTTSQDDLFAFREIAYAPDIMEGTFGHTFDHDLWDSIIHDPRGLEMTLDQLHTVYIAHFPAEQRPQQITVPSVISVPRVGAENKDTIQISYAPMKRGLRTMGQGFLGGAAVAGVSLYLFITVALSFLLAGVVYWVSDRAYEVSWIIGFPIRLLAFSVFLGAVFAALGALFQIVVVIFSVLASVISSAMGKE